MSSLTLLKNYNNYYNRMIKHDFLSTTMSAYDSVTVNNINFNPGDGIFTEQVINWNASWLPDYLVVDAVKTELTPSIVENGASGFYLKIANVQKVNTSDWHDLISLNFYDQANKELNLTNIGNYDNEGYGSVDFTIEGSWLLDNFSIKINAPIGVRVNVWSDNNDITFSVTNDIINADYLRALGWADNEDVWGITISGSSPDEFWGTATCHDYNSKWIIGSSWFVMQAERIRKGQYRLSLKRDNIADHFETIVNSPAYIEKATIKNFNDPAIFNKEDLFVNQIKKQEKLLKDKTNMAWLVAWINNNIDKDAWEGLFSGKSVPYTRNIETSVSYTTDDIEDWISDHQLSGTYKCLKETDDYMWFKVQNEFADTSTRIIWAWMDYKIYRDKNHEANGGVGGHRDAYRYNFKDETPFGTMIAQTTTINDQLYNAVKSAEGFITGLDSRFSYINKIVQETKDGVTKYYKIEASYSDWDSSVTYSNTSAVANLFTNLPDGQKNTVYVTFKGDRVTFSYRDVTNEMATTANIYANVSAVTPKNSGLIDAPYMAVCIPYTLNESLTGESRQDVISDGDSFNARIDSTKAFAAITLLSYCLQDGQHLYDVQLLPYCPIVNEIDIVGPYHDSFMINADEIADNRKIKFYQTDGSTFDTTTPLMEAFVFFNSSFTFDIPLVINDKSTVFEKKLASETELYRFNSPNYSSYFDFNPYMNNGMTKLNVDCTYKPYKSYIHLNPDFKGLYGSDFNDARGLVITSDFSIPQVTDAWQTYQIQNKNYADIFNRTQQHLRTEQKWAEAESAMNMFTAPFSGATMGGLAGSKAGPYGAIAGAVVGGVTGLAGGIADFAKTRELNREALNYNEDMYNYNLQNIQALPQTLSSISSYDANNKLWPFLEIYDCSDVEKEAMRNKLIYNGMKIGRIDTINSFIGETSNYIKAQLIRNEVSNLDYNELNDIGLELDKGVFM